MYFVGGDLGFQLVAVGEEFLDFADDGFLLRGWGDWKQEHVDNT